MKKLIITLVITVSIISCKQDKGKDKIGTYKLSYTCVKGHYVENTGVTLGGNMLIPYTITNFVCDEFRIDTIYDNNLKLK